MLEGVRISMLITFRSSMKYNRHDIAKTLEMIEKNVEAMF